LDKNENLDPELLSLTTSLLRNLDPMTLASYPEFASLYSKLATWVGVSPDSLMLTAGSDGVIRLAFEVFINEGDRVVHTVPTFAMYPVYCQMFGAQAHTLGYERGINGPELSVERIIAELQRVRPKLFCLPNPDSPTGTVLTQSELREVIDLCGSIGSAVLIDEAYHPFYAESCTRWTQECPQLIVARTFSKAWGLAGLRIGYVVGHPDTIALFNKIRPMYEIGTLSATLVSKMLDHVEAMDASVARLLFGKSHFVKQMNELGFSTIPTHGNFQHVAFGDKSEKIHAALEDIVLYRKDFKDDCLRGYSRFSMTTVEGFQPIISAIRSAII